MLTNVHGERTGKKLAGCLGCLLEGGRCCDCQVLKGPLDCPKGLAPPCTWSPVLQAYSQVWFQQVTSAAYVTNTVPVLTGLAPKPNRPRGDVVRLGCSTTTSSSSSSSSTATCSDRHTQFQSVIKHALTHSMPCRVGWEFQCSCTAEATALQPETGLVVQLFSRPAFPHFVCLHSYRLSCFQQLQRGHTKGAQSPTQSLSWWLFLACRLHSGPTGAPHKGVSASPSLTRS